MKPENLPSRVYQVAGVDDRDRGFNRQVPVTVSSDGVQIHFRYESVQIVIGPVQTEEQALTQLVQELHRRGYSQLRLQRLFEGEQYLGTRELWAEYPDPERPGGSGRRWKGWIQKLFGE